MPRPFSRTASNQATLVAIADGGGSASAYVQHLKFTGLDIATVSYTGAADSEPIGGPYRYVSGTTVAASLPNAGNPYESSTVAHAAWSAPANNASGNGSTASFTVSTDDTFSWSYVTNTSLPLVASDSFERISTDTEADGIEGWSGEGWVAAATYSPALPPGYPLQLEGHTQVLMVDGEPCVTSAGVRSPSNPVTSGSWYRALAGGTTAGRISSVAFKGTGAVDDVALYSAAAQPAALEFDTSAGTATNGVPYAWLSDHGLSWDTTLDLDGDGFDSAAEYAAGTDPLDAASAPSSTPPPTVFFIL